MSLMQLNDDIMPFTFADILILRYLFENADALKTVEDFDLINKKNDLNWTVRSQMVKFIKRFWKDSYRQEDSKWMKELVIQKEIAVKTKFIDLRKLI